MFDEFCIKGLLVIRNELNTGDITRGFFSLEEGGRQYIFIFMLNDLDTRRISLVSWDGRWSRDTSGNIFRLAHLTLITTSTRHSSKVLSTFFPSRRLWKVAEIVLNIELLYASARHYPERGLQMAAASEPENSPRSTGFINQGLFKRRKDADFL